MMYSTYIGILIIALQCSHVLGDCRHGWLLHGISCYYFSEKSKDWTSASASCRAHGAELVIVESQGENDFIAGEVKRLKGGFWLDGTDEFSEGMWEWASTGQAMDYTHWFPGEPNDTGNDEDCLLIHDSYPNGEWNDGLCSTHFKYICELNNRVTKEELKDTKGVIRIRKSKKNRQHNGRKKKIGRYCRREITPFR